MFFFKKKKKMFSLRSDVIYLCTYVTMYQCTYRAAPKEPDFLICTNNDLCKESISLVSNSVSYGVFTDVQYNTFVE